MTEYGVQPTGYVRKPLSVILAELEAAMVTEFGPGVVQTPQSPFGQLNGLMADLIAEIDETNLDVYQSYDPDQAEGRRLDILGRLRLVYRSGRTEEQFRQAITNTGQARIDVQDVEAALRSLPGVSFAKLFTEAPEFGAGQVAVAVTGGDDEDIAGAVRRYLVPGIGTYGNYRVSSVVDGTCRSFSIIRPVEVPVTLELSVRPSSDVAACPAPSSNVIRDAVVDEWMATRENGQDVNHFFLRSIVERRFPDVELVSFTANREDLVTVSNQALNIGFIEIAQLSKTNTEVVYL